MLLASKAPLAKFLRACGARLLPYFAPGGPTLSFCPNSTPRRAFSVLTQIGRTFRIPSDYVAATGVVLLRETESSSCSRERHRGSPTLWAMELAPDPRNPPNRSCYTHKSGPSIAAHASKAKYIVIVHRRLVQYPSRTLTALCRPTRGSCRPPRRPTSRPRGALRRARAAPEARVLLL